MISFKNPLASLRDGGFLKVELWKDFHFEESKV